MHESSYLTKTKSAGINSDRLLLSSSSTQDRIVYLWKKFRSFSKTIGRLIKVWKDIKLYGGSRNHYASTITRRESFELEEVEPAKGVIMPSSNLKKTWTLVNMSLLLWTAIVMPFEICFIEDGSYTWLGIDLTIDALFSIDIIVNFFSAYLDAEGKLVTKRKLIVKNYVKGWFLIDFTGVLPFQYLSNIGGYNKLVRFSRMPRLYRIVRIVRLFKMVRLLRSQECISKIIGLFGLTTGILRLVKFCFTVLIVIHVIGCFWYYLAKIDDFNVDSWVFRYNMVESSYGEIYLTSIYYVIQTLATVGFGDIVPYSIDEKVFALILMGVGVGFYSYTISNLSTMMASLDTRTSILKKRLSALNEFAKATQLPENLKKKIKKHINHNHQENIYSWFDKEALLKELPASLRKNISIHIHKKVVGQISFFQDKDPQFISNVVPKLKNVHMQLGEILFKEGDHAEEIFFLVRGRVSLKTTSGLVFKTYLQGSYFGEVEVLANMLRSHTVQVASSHAELLVISKRDFINVLKDFPRIYNEVKETAKVREVKNKEAKLFTVNLQQAKPQMQMKRSKTIVVGSKKTKKENKGWTQYSKTITKSPSPPITLGLSIWEKKAKLSDISKPIKITPYKKNENNRDYGINTPNINSIVFSPGQFDIMNKRSKFCDKVIELDEESFSQSMVSSKSIDLDEKIDIKGLVLQIKSEEAKAEKVLENATAVLAYMESQQNEIYGKISRVLKF
jgi:CRP-like cAMP-binding protein